MYKLSKTSKARLETCHPELQTIITTALEVSRVDFGVAEGHRTQERQNELFKLGKSKIDGIKKKGKHNYNPSLAVDIYGFVNGSINYSERVLCYLAGVIIATSNLLHESGEIDHLVRWGGNWDKDGEIITDQGFDDLVHFELYQP